MEFHEIRYFVAVCETLNFTRAAELCNVTQPTLTRAIQNLEGKLAGGPLINRERGNTHLTELGQLMRPYFTSMIDSKNAALKTARGFVETTSATLNLGLMCTIGPARMIGLFQSWYKRNPTMKLVLVDGAASDLQTRLLHGVLDAAIYCLPKPLDDKFHALPLYRERFVVAFPPGHEWANRELVRFSDLNEQPYLNRINCEYTEHIDEIFARQAITPFYPYESERDDWIQSMVMAGLGCTTLPEFAVSVPHLPWRPLVDPVVERTINLVTVRGRVHGPAIGALVHAVKHYDWTITGSRRDPGS